MLGGGCAGWGGEGGGWVGEVDLLGGCGGWFGRGVVLLLLALQGGELLLLDADHL